MKRLPVNIAKRIPAQSVHKLMNFPSRAVNTHDERIVGCGVAHGWFIHHSDSASDFVALLGVQSLPDPKDIINHSVVKEEAWVINGGVKISVFTVNGIMSSRV